jgi:hypothetical protein
MYDYFIDFVYKRFHQAEKGLASGSTKQSASPLVELFPGLARDGVDMQIMLFRSANGVPFNIMG